MATIICQDDLFPEFVAQIGAKKIDLLLIPSSDWDEIADWHLRVAQLRAIETGASVVRPTRTGASAIISASGNLVAQRNDYHSYEDQVLVASLPSRADRSGGIYVAYPMIIPISSATFITLALTMTFVRSRSKPKSTKTISAK